MLTLRYQLMMEMQKGEIEKARLALTDLQAESSKAMSGLTRGLTAAHDETKEELTTKAQGALHPTHTPPRHAATPHDPPPDRPCSLLALSPRPAPPCPALPRPARLGLLQR